MERRGERGRASRRGEVDVFVGHDVVTKIGVLLLEIADQCDLTVRPTVQLSVTDKTPCKFRRHIVVSNVQGGV